MAAMLQMNGVQPTEINDVLEIKQNCEKEYRQSVTDREDLERRLAALRQEQISLTDKNESKREEMTKLQLKLIDAEQAAILQEEQVKRFNQYSESLSQQINSDLDMEDFEKESMSLTATYLEAMHYYSEDKLTIEIKRKNKELNDKRMELTKLESHYSKLLAEVEEKKARKERERLEKIEKQKKSEARLQEAIRGEKEQYERQVQLQSAMIDSKAQQKSSFMRPMTPRCENYRKFRESDPSNESAKVELKSFDENNLSQVLHGFWSQYKKY